MHKPDVYRVPIAIFAPGILTVATVLLSFQESSWYLLAMPFIWIGSFCSSAPHLNLACWTCSILAVVIGATISRFFQPAGLAITFGALTGLYLSVVEKRIRMRPADTAAKFLE